MTITWEIGASMAALVSLGSAIINVFIMYNQSKKARTAEIITHNRVEWMQKLKDYISSYTSEVEYYYDKKVPNDLDKYMNVLFKQTANIKLHLNLEGDPDKEIVRYIETLNSSFENFLQLSKYKDIFGQDANKKSEAFSHIIDYYIYNYPEKIGTDVGKNILKNGKVNVNDKEECKKYFLNLVSNKDKYYEKMFDEIVKYVDNDLKKSIRRIKYIPKLIMLLTQVYLKAEWERVKLEAEKGIADKINFDNKYYAIRKIFENEIIGLEEKIK